MTAIELKVVSYHQLEGFRERKIEDYMKCIRSRLGTTQGAFDLNKNLGGFHLDCLATNRNEKLLNDQCLKS